MQLDFRPTTESLNVPLAATHAIICNLAICQHHMQHSSQCGMQVMLAQQESIAQLMTLYEAVRSQSEEELQQVLGHGYGQPNHQLEALHQEHALGQAHIKKDRCCFTWCTCTLPLSHSCCLSARAYACTILSHFSPVLLLPL